MRNFAPLGAFWDPSGEHVLKTWGIKHIRFFRLSFKASLRRNSVYTVKTQYFLQKNGLQNTYEERFSWTGVVQTRLFAQQQDFIRNLSFLARARRKPLFCDIGKVLRQGVWSSGLEETRCHRKSRDLCWHRVSSSPLDETPCRSTFPILRKRGLRRARSV